LWWGTFFQGLFFLAPSCSKLLNMSEIIPTIGSTRRAWRLQSAGIHFHQNTCRIIMDYPWSIDTSKISLCERYLKLLHVISPNDPHVATCIKFI
jgi:hypothetical protein